MRTWIFGKRDAGTSVARIVFPLLPNSLKTLRSTKSSWPLCYLLNLFCVYLHIACSIQLGLLKISKSCRRQRDMKGSEFQRAPCLSRQQKNILIPNVPYDHSGVAWVLLNRFSAAILTVLVLIIIYGRKKYVTHKLSIHVICCLWRGHGREFQRVNAPQQLTVHQIWCGWFFVSFHEPAATNQVVTSCSGHDNIY